MLWDSSHVLGFRRCPWTQHSGLGAAVVTVGASLLSLSSSLYVVLSSAGQVDYTSRKPQWRLDSPGNPPHCCCAQFSDMETELLQKRAHFHWGFKLILNESDSDKRKPAATRWEDSSQSDVRSHYYRLISPFTFLITKMCVCVCILFLHTRPSLFTRRCGMFSPLQSNWQLEWFHSSWHFPI